VGELPDELAQRRRSVGARHGVGADLAKQSGSLGRGQSGDHGHVIPSPGEPLTRPRPESATGGRAIGQKVVTGRAGRASSAGPEAGS